MLVSFIFLFSGCTSLPTHASLKNMRIFLDGEPVLLQKGISELSIVESSASKKTTQYFGNELLFSPPNSNKSFTAFLVTQDFGGSGTFYYLVVVQNNKKSFKFVNSFFIGDRISPQPIFLSPDNPNQFIFSFGQRVIGNEDQIVCSVTIGFENNNFILYQ
ncbi:MAG: hypothetical protein ACRC5H_09130 [Treponemataceae bacterium]